jgi:hypothetical protein
MSDTQHDGKGAERAERISRANDLLSDDNPTFRLGEFRKLIAAAYAETWPKYEAFLEHGRKHGDSDVAALASINLLNHFGYSRPQKQLLSQWDDVFKQVKETKNLGDYLTLARIAAKRLSKARYDKIIGLAFRQWGSGLDDPSGLSDSQLKQVRRFASAVCLAGDETALLDEFDRRGMDSGLWRRNLNHAKAMHDALSSSLSDIYWRRWSDGLALEDILNGGVAEAGVLNVYPKLFLNPDMPEREAYMLPFLRRLYALADDRGLKVKYQRASCNPTIAPPAEDGAMAVSFHTIADEARPGSLHIKESHLRDIVSVDRTGYSAWGEVAKAPMTGLAEPDGAFGERLRERYVERDYSYLGDPARAFEAPAENYLAVFLQINQDTTQVATKIPLTQLIRIVAVWARNHQAHVVFKRHPACQSFEVALALNREVDGGFVHASDASIHDIARDATGVVTTNSGSGFEALLQGKTVITTGQSDYQQATLKARTPDDLRETLTAVVAGKRVAPDKIASFVEAYIKRHCIDMIDGDLDAQIEQHVLGPLMERTKKGASG